MLGLRFSEAFARLPDYLGSHVLVSMVAMALGLGISLPLAIFALRRPRLRSVLLGVASTIQTVPGLALLTLFYPLLLALSTLTEKTLGFGFSALGFLPSVLALALYSMLPILRNSITGLSGVEEGVHDAARALGLTRRKTFWLIDVPIAMPIIMAGIRTATVWVIGTATLSTPIGQTSLGNYIFAGLQTQNWVFVLFGCFAAAALALLVDRCLAAMELGVARRNQRIFALGAGGVTLIVLAALAPHFVRVQSSYSIGAKTFAEQYILAALMEQRVDAAGMTASTREGLGSTVIFNALANNEIDAYVEYTGTIWANLMGRKDVKSRSEVMAEVGAWAKEKHGITMVGGLGFENAYALAMSRKRAEELGIRTIADLARHAPQMTIAGDYEFFARPEWRAVKAAYGLNFASQRQMQAQFMYPAAANGDVDVVSAFSSDGLIAKYDLVVLEDPKQSLPPYDAILLVSPARANDAKFIDALKPLIGKIDVETMRDANLRANTGTSPDEVARWLWKEIGAK
ncbi:MAG: ABC transporter permease/substrate-binding protein [Pseudolabrys sp.]|nr:ABC transporter permease/substrate-binding protein [Pseudolabrys sp.]